VLPARPRSSERTTRNPRPPVGAALHNRALQRALTAFFASTVADWALWIGALVYAHDHGGASAAGYMSIALTVPAALITPFAGSKADSHGPNRLLAMAYGAQALCMTLASIAAFADAPLWAVVAPMAAVTTLVTFVRPSYSIAIPGLVTSTNELTAANVLVGYFENAAILVGPLVAAALLALDGAALVLAGCAVLVAASAWTSIPLVQLDPPSSFVDGGRSHAESRAIAPSPVRRLARRPGALALLIVLGGQYLLIGGLDLLFVVMASDQLHLSASGPAILTAAFGLGAITGGGLSTLFVARDRLAPFMICALTAVVIAMTVLGAELVLVTALLLLPVVGMGRTVLDVSGRMLLQRAAPQDAVASVFATLEALTLAGTALGAVVVQAVIAMSGVRAAVLTLAGTLGVLLIASASQLRRVDDVADAPVVAIRLLRSTAIFASLPPIEIEGVARAGSIAHVESGSTIITQDEPGDRYYVVAGGTVDIFIDGTFVRTMGRPEGFGEIALLVDAPRTATVIAASDGDLFFIDRVPFLRVVTGHDTSRHTAWAVARGYRTTNVDQQWC
jgi:hypothetical protein